MLFMLPCQSHAEGCIVYDTLIIIQGVYNETPEFYRILRK
jgi:hypothetical protein